MPKRGQSDYNAGWVYIALSNDLGIGKYKVGLSRNLAQRERQLNVDAYGGFIDWKIVDRVPVSSMRAVERKTHDWIGPPVRLGDESSREIFDAPFPKVRNFLHMMGRNFKPRHRV